ncbi:hypothetical protein CD30_18545 [Ureibacillus massiliensis 4400831 = CIP 108448 = CCUG 49529]|uniref:Uncharacterized protein n=1 Tax=Ureibacillus massiliensis 4400831 = CIP 108448 = CCUG 49529 TaxID=1211035 RepID=A0A0A3IT80_9BACL|nr:hypothetical protein [Ureibacillus massiliensis]KGR87969.1 hypothetical protein CD30_18545 [Ureibacillus massiliensis 4400831 = CIP 108448 = CCUG 49529]BDH63561.1 hypothetical protein MTP04_36910 [Lysinibacillus sp. PLM2]
MGIKFKTLFEFQIFVEEDTTSTNPYQVNVIFSGDFDFYEQLILVAKRDKVVLTGRPAPFTMKLLFRTKYLYYLEQRSNKKLNFLYWRLEDILANKKELLIFKDRDFVNEFREALIVYLNRFAKEVEEGKL